MPRLILPSVTTILKDAWREKVAEIDELGLKQVALFPTNLEKVERQELYHQLEKTGIKEIPHVHMRHDMGVDEIEYLIDRFKTKTFNIHAWDACLKFIQDNQQYREIIYVENIRAIDKNFLSTLNLCAGLCLDFAHWEMHTKYHNEQTYEMLPELTKKFKIGVNHLSAIGPTGEFYTDEKTGTEFEAYDQHYYQELSQFDYLTKYKEYFAGVICIELDNSLHQQLDAMVYIKRLLSI